MKVTFYTVTKTFRSFFVLKHLDVPKLVFLSVSTIIETICPKIGAKSQSKNEKKTTSA